MRGVALVLSALLARAQAPGMAPGDRLLNRLAIESAAGVTVPHDAVMFSFDLSLKPADRISIIFNERTGMMAEARGGGVPGAMTPGTLTAPVDIVAPEAIDSPVPLAPPGLVLSSSRVEVHVEGVLDLTGRVRFARALDGPPELQAIAAEAVGKWRYQPAMMFHVPIPLVIRATVTFTQ
jgi:hypothetical protein